MTPFPWITRAARAVLDEADVDRMVLPTLADAIVEDGERAGLAARARVAGRVALVVVAALAARTREAAAATAFWPVAAAALAGVAGGIGLEEAASARLAAAHVAFVAVGAVVGVALAVAPARLFRLALGAAAVAVAAALPLVLVAGESFDGARRWIAVGPLAVRVSVIALPVLGEGLARLARSRRAALHLGALAAAFGLLLAQPDAPSVVALAIVAVASSLGTARLAIVAAMAIGASAIAVRAHAPAAPVEHVEGAIALLAGRSAPWLAVAVVALAATIGGAVAFAVRAARVPAIAGRAAAVAAGLVALAGTPLALGDGGVPWIAFGGSATVAAFALVGLGMRLAREAAAATA